MESMGNFHFGPSGFKDSNAASRILETMGVMEDQEMLAEMNGGACAKRQMAALNQYRVGYSWFAANRKDRRKKKG